MRGRLVMTLILSLLAAGSIAAAALGDGLPVRGVDVGGGGVLAPAADGRYVTLPAGGSTVVARVRTSDGRVDRSQLVRGRFTIPAVAYDSSASGLSADGRTLVLIEP